MRFLLSDSPFKNISKFVGDPGITSYLEPKLRSLLWTYRKEKGSCFPPSCFVFNSSEGVFLLGWSYSTPSSFVVAARYEANRIGADLALMLAEVTSLSSPDHSFLVVEVQALGTPASRYLMKVQEPGWLDTNSSYTEISDLEAMDPIDRDILMSSNESSILGLSDAFQWVLPEPCV